MPIFICVVDKVSSSCDSTITCTCIPFFYVTLHLNHVWERQAVYEKYRNINYRASLFVFKNRSVQNPVRGKPRVTIWSHL